MTIKQMQAFAAVCSEGSVTKAAESLFIAQSAVSRTLLDLSEQYHFQLFEHIGGRLKPTALAVRILEDVNEILDLYKTLEEKLSSGGFAPSLNIGCSMAIGESIMLEVISRFEKLHPQAKLYIFENHTAEIEQRLLVGELDFGIIAGSIRNVRLVEENFDEEDFCWVCSPDHPIAGEGEVTLARLAEEKLYLPGRDVGGIRPLEQYALEQGVELKPMWTMVNVSASLRATLAGRCVSLFSHQLVEKYVKAGRLAVIPTAMKITRKRSAVYLRRKRLSPEARAFIDICADVSKQAAEYQDSPAPPR